MTQEPFQNIFENISIFSLFYFYIFLVPLIISKKTTKLVDIRVANFILSKMQIKVKIKNNLTPCRVAMETYLAVEILELIFLE